MNRIPLFGLLLVCIFLSTGFQSKSLKSQVVGAWRYDAKSLSIAFMPKAKKELAKQGASGLQKIEGMKQGLRSQLQGITLYFKQNGTLLVTAPGGGRQVTGRWAMINRQVVILMDKKGQSVPVMHIEPGGKKIRTTFLQKDVATGTVYLLKVAG